VRATLGRPHEAGSQRLGRPQSDTRNREYTQRLASLPEARWKRWLDVQAPYRRHLRGLDLGFTLDVGCGTGRSLAHCGGHGVGIDHNPASVEIARARGLNAYGRDEFWRTPHAETASFDSLLFSHVLEHMEFDAAAALVAEYAPLVRATGLVVCICPQEAGFRSDPSHVAFCEFASLRRIADAAGLEVEQSYSFPFPRIAGRLFRHNEFVLIARKPG